MIVETLTRMVNETSVNITNNRVDSVRRKDIQKTGIRVYRDGRIGTAGTIGAPDRERLVAEAVKALDDGIEYPAAPAPGCRKKVVCEARLPGHDRLAAEVEHLLEDLTCRQPEFIFSNKVNCTEEEECLENTCGLDLRYKDSRISVELVFKEKSSTSIMDGFVEVSTREFDRDRLQRHIEAVCEAYRNPVDLPEQRTCPVIFSASDGQILGKFASDLNGKAFAAGSSLFSGMQEKQAFNPAFTLYQSRAPQDGFNCFFDAEGTVAEDLRYPLIEKGILRSPYTDRRISLQYGLPLTGAAVCEYDGVPVLPSRLENLSVAQTGKSLRELLGGEKGIYILAAEGGDFSQKGDFATPAQVAFLMDEHGLIGRLPEIQLSSSLWDMFGSGFRGTTETGLYPGDPNRLLVLDMKVRAVYA